MEGHYTERGGSPSAGEVMQIPVISDHRKWPENHSNFGNEQFQMDDSSQLNESQQISYRAYTQESNNMESQDIFLEDRNEDNEIEENSGMASMIVDPELMIDIEEMGREFLEIQQEISQRQNDLGLLADNIKLVEEELEEKQKLLETTKIELLTELDNYDNIEKKLVEEIDLITTISSQQEAMKNILKNFISQKDKVNQLITNCKAEFNQLKENAEALSYIHQSRMDELKKKLDTLSDENVEVRNNKLLNIKEKEEIEAKIKLAINNMEKMFGKLEVKRHQQTAILEYLKNKGDEEWSKYKNLEVELDSVAKNGCQQISSEEIEFTAMITRAEELSGKLLEMKNNIINEEKSLNTLIIEENKLNEIMHNFQQNEAQNLQEISVITNELLQIEDQLKELDAILQIKHSIKDENDQLKDVLAEHQVNKDDVLRNAESIRCTIIDLTSLCDDHVNKLEEVRRATDATEGEINLLKSKKVALTEQIKANTEKYEHFIDSSLKHKENLETVKMNLENDIKNMTSKTEENENGMEEQRNKNEQIKLQLVEVTGAICNFNQEIKDQEAEVIKLNEKFEIDFARIDSEIHDKETVKAAKYNEIDRRFSILQQIEELRGDLLLLDVNQREELESLKHNQNLVLKETKENYEKKVIEFESKYREEKMAVGELQEDLIDDQKKEIHLIKSIQQLSHIRDQNKEELIKLGNVIKTLDIKMNKIAQAIQWKTEKESTICTQDTVSSSVERPSLPSYNPSCAKRAKTSSTYRDDSSSSGVSMHDGDDKLWKKKLLMRQEKKRAQFMTPKNPDQDVSMDTSSNSAMNPLSNVDQICTASKASQDEDANKLRGSRVKKYQSATRKKPVKQ